MFSAGSNRFCYCLAYSKGQDSRRTFGFIFIASPENSENLAQVKRYNVRSITSLGNNIVAVQEELGIIENKREETNKILNKFYKGDKNLSPDEEKIVKKLKN